MKKIFTSAIFLMFILIMPCYAQQINSSDLGISFALSDNWVSSYSDYETMSFNRVNTDQEFVSIECFAHEVAYSLDFYPEENLKSLCDEMYSNSNLSGRLQYGSTVTTDSVVTKYEYYNGVKYYRYEKAFTSSGYMLDNTAFYVTSFITAQNGKIYTIEYARRKTEQNNFMDIYNMLNSMSYDNGAIKITINGERIYPDTTPMLIEERTLVPIRAVAEKMGYTVAWDGENQAVIMESQKDGTSLIFVIGANAAVKNYSEEIPLDVPAVIVEDRTYLPLRAVAEAMDAEVGWIGETKTVVITQN